MADTTDDPPDANPVQGLLREAQSMQARILATQDLLRKREYTGSCGGGFVKVRFSGRPELLAIEIDPAFAGPADLPALQDMVIAAINDGLTRMEKEKEAVLAQTTGGMTIPGLF